MCPGDTIGAASDTITNYASRRRGVLAQFELNCLNIRWSQSESRLCGGILRNRLFARLLAATREIGRVRICLTCLPYKGFEPRNERASPRRNGTFNKSNRTKKKLGMGGGGGGSSSLGKRLAKALPGGGYVLQRILKYFNCSGSCGTLEGFIRNHSIESMNRD